MATHFKGYLPGGASGGILPAYMADIPLDFGQLEKHGAFVGCHAVVIPVAPGRHEGRGANLMNFFEDESCGQCTPCRNGTEKAVKLMAGDGLGPERARRPCRRSWPTPRICGLGQAAPNPLKSVIKYFPEDLR